MDNKNKLVLQARIQFKIEIIVGRNEFAEVKLHLGWTYNNLLGYELDGRISQNWEKWITSYMTSHLSHYLFTAPQSTFCRTFLIHPFCQNNWIFLPCTPRLKPPSTVLH